MPKKWAETGPQHKNGFKSILRNTDAYQRHCSDTMSSQKPFILLITRSAGGGKSAAALAWDANLSRPAMHIPLDEVCWFMKSGLENPEDGWNDECQWQHDLVPDACAGLARLYLSRGFSCAIDDAVFYRWEAVRYQMWANVLNVPFRITWSSLSLSLTSHLSETQNV